MKTVCWDTSAARAISATVTPSNPRSAKSCLLYTSDAADVSQKTVFNYFPRKEDLVFWRLEAFEEEILSAVRGRARGEPALAAFRRFVLAQRGLIVERDPAAREELLRLSRVIADSPALVARGARPSSRWRRPRARRRPAPRRSPRPASARASR